MHYVLGLENQKEGTLLSQGERHDVLEIRDGAGDFDKKKGVCKDTK